MNNRNALFAHSPYDLALVLVALTGIGLLLLAVLAWQSASTGLILMLFVVQAVLICTNYQCVAHNFTHNEFFSAPALNYAFSIINSIAIGFPQTIFKQHHLNHHQFNNAPLAKDGVSSGDLSSLYRYSKTPGKPEGFLAYSLLSPLRADIPTYVRRAMQRHRSRLFAEAGALAAIIAVFAAASPSFLLLYYLPLIYFGHVLTYAEGYFEHNHAMPGDKMRNAASCYGRLYNIVWFNNGYHQEHHCYPQVHWTAIKPFKSKMLPENERRIARGAHWTNL